MPIKEHNLTQERLKELLHYDPETGIFTRIKPQNNRYAVGCVAGSPHKTLGYIQVWVDRKSYYGHRLAWLYMTGSWPDKLIDHRDCDPANNKWCNLRQANSGQNVSNSKLPKNNTSGYKGVTWSEHAKRWHAAITVNEKSIYLGYFLDPKEAHNAYCEAAIKYKGEFARAS